MTFMDKRTTVVYAVLAAFGTAMIYSLYRGDLLLLTGGMLFFAAVAAGFLYPQVFLLLYAVLIPFEDVIQISGIGTLSRGIGLFFALCYVIARFRDIRLNAVPLSLWLWFGWMACSMLWAFNPSVAWKTIFLMSQQMVMLLLIANAVGKHPRMAAAILWAYTLAAAVTGAIASQRYMLHAAQGPGRAQAFDTQDEAHFAALCVPGLLFCIHRLMTNRSKLRALLLIPMLAILTIAVLMSGTRSAWLAVLVSLAIILLPRMNAKKMAVLAIGFALLALLASRLPNLFEFINARASDAVSSGGSGRTSIWRVGFTNFTEHPLFGVGIGSFPKTFDWELIQKTFMSSGGVTGMMQEGRAPHNIYLGTLVETGLIGLFLMLAVFRKMFLAGKAAYSEGLLINAIIVSYMVQGFFLDMLKRKYLWLAIALSVGLQYAAEKARKTKEEENRRVGLERSLAHTELSQPNGPGRRHLS